MTDTSPSGSTVSYFYVKARDRTSYFALAYRPDGVLLRFFENSQCVKERSFSKPPWRSSRLATEFQRLLADYSYDSTAVESDIITAYDSFVTAQNAATEDAKLQEQSESDSHDEYVSSVVINDVLHEQVMIDGEPYFIRRTSNGFEYIDHIDADGYMYFPILDDAVRQQAVHLPAGVLDYGTVEDLVDRIRNHINQYLDVSADFLTFASYYVLLSWVYDHLDNLPYLRALGDTGTGKSRFLRVIGGLCYKPTFVAGSITPAPIYRLIRKWGGTLVLDEADFQDSSEKSEVITILNCGFSRGTPVIRCEKDNPDNVQFFPTFGPKVIATRYSFADKALESRCLTEVMHQTTRRDIPRILPPAFAESEHTLRQMLLQFRFDQFRKVNTAVIHQIDLGPIEPRLEQATLSFAILFYHLPEMFARFKDFLQSYQTELVEERASSYDGQVVTSMLQLIEERKTYVDESLRYVSAQDIVDRLRLMGLQATSQGVGKRLRSLGIHTHKKRLGDRFARVIVIDEQRFQSLRDRYGVQQITADPPPDSESTPKNETTDQGLHKYSNQNQEKTETDVSNSVIVSNVSAVLFVQRDNSVCDVRGGGGDSSSHTGEGASVNDTPDTNDTNTSHDTSTAAPSTTQTSPQEDEPESGWMKCLECGKYKYHKVLGCISCGHVEASQ